MSFRLDFHPEASDELRAAERYINVRRRGWGAKFRAAVNSALEFVKSRPGGRVQRSGNYWTVKVERFPYRKYYRVMGDVIWVYAVYHGGRKEGVWQWRKF